MNTPTIAPAQTPKQGPTITSKNFAKHFSEALAWEAEVYGNDPTGGAPSNY